LPSGSVTFLLTDIEGSTPLLKRLGERYEPLLERHHHLLRTAWADHGGAEFKAEGDALLVAFDSADAAFRAAVDGQRRLRSESWPPDAPIRVRMGLHTGIAYARDGDYIALALHQAARVVGAANGGQVLASADAVAAAGGTEVVARRLGAYRLRDFDGPADLYEITATGEPVDPFPVLRAVPAEGHNLAKPLDTFVGRVAEIAELDAVVEPRRLVTLLGPGGIGKTRLTVEFALRVAPTWDDGVWMIDLAALPASQPIDFAVAETLGVVVSADAGPADSVVEHLRSRRALLILDNCEHVLAGARDVARRVLADCPGTALLATSRERLGIGGEHTVVVRPLPLADECIDLFLDRAKGRDISFHVDGGDRAVLLDICRRLDGMPLGIELAAARANVLSPTEILDRLHDRLASLQRRDDAVVERQRALKSLLDWSYDLLSPAERAVFRRLSVFVGSFDLRTAAAAVGHGQVDPDDVPEVVWSLADKSLVYVELREGSTRYRLLETIGSVAAVYSESAGDAAATRRALGERYLADFPLGGKGNRTWRARLALEQSTVLQLVDLLLIDGEIELAHALARLGVAHDAANASSLETLRVLLPLLQPGRPVSRGSARLEALAAKMLAERGDLSGAEEHLAAGRRLVTQFGDHDRHGLVLFSRAQSQLSLRYGSEAALRRVEGELRSELERSLPPMTRADTLVELALVCQALGVTPRREFLREVAEIAERHDDQMVLMTALNNLAEEELRAGDTPLAARDQRAAVRLSAELGVTIVTAFGLVVAARIAQPAGLDAMAVRLHAAADAMLDALGFELLPDDRALSDAMLAAARATLGDDEFGAEIAAGRARELPDLLLAADEVFEQVMRTG